MIVHAPAWFRAAAVFAQAAFAIDDLRTASSVSAEGAACCQSSTGRTLGMRASNAIRANRNLGTRRTSSVGVARVPRSFY